ncbi:MAG: hypothetical protein BWK80_17940 [Desulfobacteraceae bacterium IS3]|nr:MAG: hypothetical protein BWK80_17940 [Desulfobacteraceae bacterium IS3]HAO23093.1 hypothetical protein [Desulfobacteraceae bacterium]
MQTTLQLSAYEEILMGIVRSLPAERVAQILDYARYIQSQIDGLINEDETEEQIRADEAHWNSQFAATQDGLKKMADKVRAEIRAGRTIPMVLKKEGKIVPG